MKVIFAPDGVTVRRAPVAETPADPLRAALRGIGARPLCPRATSRYMATQVRRHSSSTAWQVSVRLFNEVVVPLLAILARSGAFGLVLTVAAGICWVVGASASVAPVACQTGAALVLLGATAVGVVVFAERFLPPARRAAWSAVSLDERFRRYGYDALPESLWPVADGVIARCPDARLRVHVLYVDETLVDPVLEAATDDEVYYLGAWDGDGASARLADVPTLSL